MARPAKKFTPAEAHEIQLFLRSKVMAPDFYSDLVVPVDCISGDAKRARVDEAQAQFDAIEGAAADDQPELLKAWLDEYLQPETWKRVQAAMRQRKVTRGSGAGDTLVLMSRPASWDFDELAAKAGLTKKELAERLGDFFLRTKLGKTAFQHFGDYCTIEAAKVQKLRQKIRRD